MPGAKRRLSYSIVLGPPSKKKRGRPAKKEIAEKSKVKPSKKQKTKTGKETAKTKSVKNVITSRATMNGKGKNEDTKKEAAKKAPAKRKHKESRTVPKGSDDIEKSAPAKKKRTYTKKIKDAVVEKDDSPGGPDLNFTEPLPTRNKAGELVFRDWKEFRPNMTPKEVLQAGSFGGTYFRPIYSGVTKQKYTGVWKELPNDWLAGLNIGKQVSSSNYDNEVNTYKVKCGGSLEMWESSGWIHAQDPYGWFMWYCRFYQGRRTEDDERQVGRWLRCAGPKGRWKNNLIAKCVRSGCAYDNVAVSPVVRQTLQHWGYKLTKEHHDAYAKKVK